MDDQDKARATGVDGGAWQVWHRAAQAASRFRDLALAHLDRPVPVALHLARKELVECLGLTQAAVSCALCQFWSPVPDEDGHQLGLCRRLPPAYEGWPMTMDRDWCGEFALKAQPGVDEANGKVG